MSGGAARTFLAVFPPAAVRRDIAEACTRLAPQVTGLRWTPAENLHFTLRFLGDLNPEEVNRAKKATDRATEQKASFALELGGFGVFPGWRRPRVLWLGCNKGSEALVDLAHTLERALRAAGFPPADKPFVPHLTVGRWKRPGAGNTTSLQARCQEEATVATIAVGQIEVMESRLSPEGPSYISRHAGLLGGG